MYRTSDSYYPSPSTGMTHVTYYSRSPNDSPAMQKAKTTHATNANASMSQFCTYRDTIFRGY